MYRGINAQNLKKLLPIYNRSSSRKELLSELKISSSCPKQIFVYDFCEKACSFKL